MEIWEKIDGFDGRYSISNKGRVMRHYFVDRTGNAHKETILKPCANKKLGYWMVTISYNNKNHALYIHRLLALAFIPLMPGKNCVNHIDANRGNNDLSNLEWVTHRENIQHAASLGLMKGPLNAFGENAPASKLMAKDVEVIRGMLARGLTLRKIGAVFGVSGGTIGFIKSGKTWTSVTGMCFDDDRVPAHVDIRRAA